LKAQVYSLKQELRWHINNGCRVFVGGKGAQTASPDSTTAVGRRTSGGSSNEEEEDPSAAKL